VGEHDRIRWGRALALTGWLSTLAYLTYLTAQLRLAAAIDTGSFEDGVWGQRVEQVSFAALPQNVTILMPAVGAAVAGTLLARPLVDPVVVQLQRLVRIVAGLSIVIIAIGVIGIVAVFARNFDPVGDVRDVLGRVGGVLLAVAALRLCAEAERAA
jgi:hypothetical protein